MQSRRKNSTGLILYGNGIKTRRGMEEGGCQSVGLVDWFIHRLALLLLLFGV